MQKSTMLFINEEAKETKLDFPDMNDILKIVKAPRDRWFINKGC